RRPGVNPRCDQGCAGHHRLDRRGGRAYLRPGDVEPRRATREGRADRALARRIRPPPRRPQADDGGREGAALRPPAPHRMAGGAARQAHRQGTRADRTGDPRAREAAVTVLKLASRRTFASLRRHYNYRLYFAGQLTSVCGTWMQNIALAWLVVQLAPHNKGLALAMFSIARFGPFMLIGLFAGV